MASVVHQRNDRKAIDFKTLDGRCRRIRLGQATEEQAVTFRKNVEMLLAAQRLGSKPGPAVTRWIQGLSNPMRAKLEKFGLVKPAATQGLSRLGEFLNEHLKTLEVKQSTTTNYGHTRRCLIAHFGKEKPLKDITPVDGDRWRQALKAEGLSESTVNRRVGIARQMFRRAIKWKLLTENPFADVKMGTQTNKARMFFVTPEMACKVIDALPDSQWKLLFALSRYGGLRCPSEHLLLKWPEVDWERGRICIHSPKTEHHAGGDLRYIPDGELATHRPGALPAGDRHALSPSLTDDGCAVGYPGHSGRDAARRG